MNLRIRRMGDGIAGAIVATVILAGGAAYAAGTVIDDNPKGDTPSTDDRLGGFDSSASTTSSTVTTNTITTSTIDDRGGDRGTSTTSSTTVAAGPAPTVPASGGLATAVADAGSVAVVRDGAILRFGTITPAAGWTVRVERDSAVEIEVSFLNGAARVDFNAELEDGQIRTRVRDRRLEGASSTTSTIPDDSSSSSTTTPAAAPVARTLQSAGGNVSVTITGSRVTLVAATPAAGFAADVRKSGPDTVEVRFTSGKRESRVEIRIDNGVPRERIEDR